jgi:F-type H+-transporting ATPase subunit delta
VRNATIARNYAEALLELGERNGEAEAYGSAFGELDRALGDDPLIRRFMETPKVDQSAKQAAVRNALEGKTPEMFLRFLMVMIGKHRQGLLHEVREQYDALLDRRADRVHAQITLARPADEATVKEIGDRLSKMLGKEVVPHIQVNPALVGGIIVKWGDRVLDGSLRRQLLSLKREMMHATLPQEAGAGA